MIRFPPRSDSGQSYYFSFSGHGMECFTPGKLKGTGEKTDVFATFCIHSLDRAEAGEIPDMECNGALNLPIVLVLRWVQYIDSTE